MLTAPGESLPSTPLSLSLSLSVSLSLSLSLKHSSIIPLKQDVVCNVEGETLEDALTPLSRRQSLPNSICMLRLRAGVDGLWAGLPLLTAPGESLPSRVPASLALEVC